MSVHQAIESTEHPPIVTVVDDDELMREDLAYWLEQGGFEPRPLNGPYGRDLDRLVEDAAKGADFVLCDNRLATHGFLEYPGTEVVARLNARRKPTVLVTQYAGPDAARIKRFLPQMPIIISRAELDTVDFRSAFEACEQELNGSPPPQRKAYRTIVQIDSVGDSEPGTVVAFVPSWKLEDAVTFPLSLFPKELRGAVLPGVSFFAEVNINAESASDLFYQHFEIAPEPQDRGF